MRRRLRDLQTARLATLGPDGAPHVAPLWFVWQEDAVYLSTRKGSTSWLHAEREPRVSLVVDTGRDWTELAGAIIEGRAELLVAQDPAMKKAISAWHEKYRQLLGGKGFQLFTERVVELGFLRVAPERAKAWDHATS